MNALRHHTHCISHVSIVLSHPCAAVGVKNEDANGTSLDAKGTGGSQSLAAEDAGLAAATAPGRLQGGNSNIAGKVPAPEAMAATALNVADAPAMDTLASTAPTTVAAIAGVQPMSRRRMSTEQ